MQPSKNNVLNFIYRTPKYFQIPDFQRPYTWDSAIVDTFLNDLEHVKESNRNHYFGTIVYFPEGDHFTVIDGQQRLTTTLLMLVAIYHILRENPEKARISADQVKNTYLYDQYGAPDKDRKILLRTVTTDDKVFKNIFEEKKLESDEAANRQKKVYDQFKRYFLQRDSLETYINTLERFEVITVAIDQNDDNPQLIFESINSTGAPLSSGDKIRNYSLMLNSDTARKHVYKHYWENIEKTLTRRDGNDLKDDITGFYRHFLQCKVEDSFPEAQTYTRFKEYFNDRVGLDHQIPHLDAYYDDLLLYLEAYCFVKFGDDDRKRFTYFKEYNFRLQYLELATRTSFLMDILVEFIKEKITKDEVKATYKALETFLVRRLMCNMGTASLNKAIPTWFKQTKRIRDKHPSNTFDEAFRRLILDGKGRTRVFPNDAEMRNAIENYPMGTYVNRNIVYFLSCIEDSIQPKESRLLSQISTGAIKFSIEHIMPQKLSSAWKNELGRDAEIMHETWLNRLANLTLTGYNSNYSNKAFREKRNCENGFKNSPLNINRDIAKHDAWNEKSLKEREKQLTTYILREWPALTSPITSDDLSNTLYSITEKVDCAHSSPVRVIIAGNELEVPDATWKQFTEVICKHLIRLDPAIFETFVTDDDFMRSKRRWISDTPDLIRSPFEIADGVFIETNLSANSTHDFVQLIAEKYQLEDDIRFELRRKEVTAEDASLFGE